MTEQTHCAALQLALADEQATVALGDAIARHCAKALQEKGGVGARESLVIYLHGDLGAGKTTLCRGIVRGLGHRGAVKSPTFTLVEPYQLAACQVYHFDLYRLSDPEEFEFIGVDNYFAEHDSLCLVEWPERGEGAVPAADLIIELAEVIPAGAGVTQPDAGGRSACLAARSDRGAALLAALLDALRASVDVETQADTAGRAN